MRYPNSTMTYQKKISHANRGMKLEEYINDANKYYLENNIALIYKKPTPIGIIDVKNENNQKIINKAYFKEASTLDYSGVYKGKYIEFDAKQTLNKTSFPLSNILNHQLVHINNVINHGGITFLIINIDNDYYIYLGKDLIDFIKKEKRKSIPLHVIKEKGYKILPNNLIIVDYIKQLDKIIGGTNEEN